MEISLRQEAEQLEQHYETAFKRKISDFKPSFLHSAAASCVGSFFFALFIGAILVIMFGLRMGFTNTFESILNDYNRPVITEKQTPARSPQDIPAVQSQQ